MSDSIEKLQADAEKARDRLHAESVKGRQVLARADEELQRKQLEAELERLKREEARRHALTTITGARAGTETVVAAVDDEIKTAKAGAKADAQVKEG